MNVSEGDDKERDESITFQDININSVKVCVC